MSFEITSIDRDSSAALNKGNKKLFDIANVNTDNKVLPAPEGSVSRRCPDITKLKSIGYKKQTSLEEGLKNTFEWYKNHYEWYSKKYTKGVYDNETK